MTSNLGRGIAALALVCALTLPDAAAAQQGADGPTLSVGGSVDLTSEYVWRGLELSDRPNIQPSVWADYGPVEVGTWGSHGLGTDFHEQDLWVTYSLPEASYGAFAVTVNDYYANPDFGADFLDYSGVEACPEGEEGFGDPPRCAAGAHTLELVGSFSAAALPLDLSLAYNFHNDPEHAAYAEASFYPSVRGFDLAFTAGGVLGESGWYYGTDGAALTNVGASLGRTFETGRFSVPVGVEVVRNPDLAETYYVAHVGVALGL